MATTTEDRLSGRRLHLAALGIAILALIPRALLFGSLARGNPYHLIIDEVHYFDLATNFLQHGELSRQTLGTVYFADRVPGYPLFVAFALCTGLGLKALWAAQCMLGAATAALTTYLASHTQSSARAVAAGIIVAVYPWLLAKNFQALTLSLFIPVVLLFLLAMRWDSRAKWPAMGALTGIAVLIRPEFMLFPPALGVMVLLVDRVRGTPIPSLRTLALRAGSAMLVFSLLVTPWLYRNAQQLDAFPILQTNSGLHLLTGNHSGASGDTFTHIIERRTNTDAQAFHQIIRSAPTDELERNEFLANVAFESITTQPVDYLRRGVRRVAYFFNIETRESMAAAIALPQSGRTVPPWYSLSWFYLLAFSSAVLIGGFMLTLPLNQVHTRLPELLLIAYYVALNFAMQGQAQYHLIVVPLFAIVVTGTDLKRLSLARGALGLLLVGLWAVGVYAVHEPEWWTLAYGSPTP